MLKLKRFSKSIDVEYSQARVKLDGLEKRKTDLIEVAKANVKDKKTLEITVKAISEEYDPLIELAGKDPLIEVVDAKFKIRGLSPRDFMDIREKCLRLEFVRGTDGKDVLTKEVDQAKFSWSVFNHALVGYEGLDLEGRTDEEVRSDLFNDKGIREWIMDKANSIFSEEDKKLADELKNSETSQSG